MSEKQKGLTPKLEIAILGIFLVIFLLWAVSKCSSTRAEYAERTETEAQADTVVTPPAATPSPPPPQSLPTPSDQRTSSTILYVTIDGLNMRDEPTLKGTVLERLELFEEVEFMNEVTDFTEEISLGKEVANEPWVKVRNRKGKIGWVYGAGVHYYKWKHPGVE